MPAGSVGLYVGKFQPFHNGHLFAIKHILSQVDQLVIAIGSSQYVGTSDQPFSAAERRQMIERSLAAAGLTNYSIVEVPDIHDAKNWVDHLRHYVPRFDVVFTNNQSVARLFQDQGYEVRTIPILPGVSGTHVRRQLAGQEHDWHPLVPPATAKVLGQSD